MLRSELAVLRLTLGLQSRTVGPEQLPSLFLIPLGKQHSGSGTERRRSPHSGLQLQQLPGNQAEVNLPLAEVKGAREKDIIVSAPEEEKRGKRWKIRSVTPNSWKQGSVWRITQDW